MNRGETTVFWTLKLCVYLLAAHALAYMTHEYSHSVSAWALGWMPAPFAVDYGHASLSNFLLLSDVSDNVSYDPIFSNGSGVAAAIIALAGPFIGNGLFYILTYQIARRWLSESHQLFVFCYGLMCAGNLWSYVPIRSLTTHADIALAAQGFGISTWALLPMVLIPTLLLTWHFFTRACLRWWLPVLSKSSDVRFGLLSAIVSYWFFIFFGESARSGSYGTLSQALSFVSIYIMFPSSMAFLLQRKPSLVATVTGRE